MYFRPSLPSPRAGALILLLATAGTVMAVLVRERTGTEGFLVGLGLSMPPVPLLVLAFRWLDRSGRPGLWPSRLFAFSWGACAAALISLLANGYATRWIASMVSDPESADHLGSLAVAPVVEEIAKGSALLLLFLFCRTQLSGILDGVVLAGLTATGFAFTENILYLGNAFTEDLDQVPTGTAPAVLASLTAATFFVRIVVSPFAHPLFTVLTGIGFGCAALWATAPLVRRTAAPLLGVALAMGVHAVWNGSSVLGEYGFYAVYVLFILPALALLSWLALWFRDGCAEQLETGVPTAVAAVGTVTRLDVTRRLPSARPAPLPSAAVPPPR
ncbi:PrsW family intramembrane metalloprotease [Streptomyces sp. NPDC006879]|uniref:PrsW family intramembrane metalloprotease n=1 Tax=Streptomyces sp. NPDC006879 TaxID=3364767 RepID=UPI0036D1D2D9